MFSSSFACFSVSNVLGQALVVSTRKSDRPALSNLSIRADRIRKGELALICRFPIDFRFPRKEIWEPSTVLVRSPESLITTLSGREQPLPQQLNGPVSERLDGFDACRLIMMRILDYANCLRVLLCSLWKSQVVNDSRTKTTTYV
jgi:hypothetical protein